MKPYIAPKLIVHGNIEHMTRNSNSCGRSDALGSGMPPFSIPGEPSGQCRPTGTSSNPAPGQS
jgi:hypothetical protein